MARVGLIVLCLIVVLGCVWSTPLSSDVVNLKVERIVDLRAPVVKVITQTTVRNDGAKPISVLHVAVENELIENQVAIEAAVPAAEELSIVRDDDVALPTDNDAVYFAVQLDAPLEPGKELNFSMFQALAHIVKPLPTVVKQGEPQMMHFSGNIFAFSPYKTVSQRTNVMLPSQIVQSYSEETPTALRKDMIHYGPYSSIDPHSFSQLAVHFQSGVPYVYVAKLLKVVEVSHWGNVNVEEYYEIVHEGAELKGQFSRWEYYVNKQRGSVPMADVNNFRAFLPAGARNGYYRDVIGNISTSRWMPAEKEVVLDVAPRFPLFGGWKTEFYIGYDLPLNKAVFREKGSWTKFVLEIPFGTSFMMLVEEEELKVILPEGAKNLAITAPVPTSEPKHSRHFTYLDTVGRPVISVSARRIAEEVGIRSFQMQEKPILLTAFPVSDQPASEIGQRVFTALTFVFQVSYRFFVLSLLQEPLVLTFSLMFLVLLMMGIVRMRISLNGKEKME